jgi:hypothetical protein
VILRINQDDHCFYFKVVLITQIFKFKIKAPLSYSEFEPQLEIECLIIRLTLMNSTCGAEHARDEA